MDTKYEELLKAMGQPVINPYATAMAQSNLSAHQAEMERRMYEAQAKRQQLEYEAMLKDEARKFAQNMNNSMAQPAFSQGTALTEDNLLKEIDRMREEEERVKKAEDKKKRQKNANTLEKLLRHEFQKTKT